MAAARDDGAVELGDIHLVPPPLEGEGASASAADEMRPRVASIGAKISPRQARDARASPKASRFVVKVIHDDQAAAAAPAVLPDDDQVGATASTASTPRRAVSFADSHLLADTSTDELLIPVTDLDDPDVLESNSSYHEVVLSDVQGEAAGTNPAALKPDLGDIVPSLLSYRTVHSRKVTRRASIQSLLYGTQEEDKSSAPPRSLAGVIEDHDRQAGGEAGDDAAQLNGRGEGDGDNEPKAQPEEDEDYDPDALRRFGLWEGVFARSLLNIFGVIMFLRLGYVFALAGIGYGVVVILLAVMITTITTLSLSAICTNGEVQGGGAYYMISRALGAQYGGIIGILFSLANAVAIAIYVIGFAEAVLAQSGGDEGDTNALRLYGVACLVFVTVLCFIGVDWVIKVQLGLLGLLVVCILSVIIGLTALNADDSIGYVGISTELFKANFGPAWEGTDKGFVHVLGIFFPAVTGIMAGANISGEVKNPSHSIPFGTLYAVGVSALVYILLGVLLGSACERVAFPLNGTVVFEPSLIPAGTDDSDLEGLRYNNLIMVDISFWGPLIYLGIYAATLSSAIASLVGAPRILQAVAKDEIIPQISYFQHGHGKNQEPWRGYTLSFAIALVFVLIADLNFVAPLITGFFMISYFFVNFACFASSYSNVPGWRPNFKWYNKWLSLFGGICCLILMFLIEWLFAVITVILSILLYAYLDHTDPDVNWGSAPEAMKYERALTSLKKLEKIKAHVKTYRLQYLVLCGDPEKHQGLVHFANQLRKGKGAMIYGRIEVVESLRDLRNPKIQEALEAGYDSRSSGVLSDMNVKGFLETVVDTSLASGARALMQLAGVSNVKPNNVLIGFKEQWATQDEATVSEYLDIIRYAFIFRNGVHVMRGADRVPTPVVKGRIKSLFCSKAELDEDMEPEDVEASPAHSHIQPGLVPSARRIDIWWLFDDGGLTILAPYVLRMHKYWAGSRLRIITATQSLSEYSRTLGEMQRMVEKFRIDAEPVVVEINSFTPEPQTIADHVLRHPSFEADRLSTRTLRHLRMSEALRKYSHDADLVYMSLPVPDMNVSCYEYMGWLDALSQNMPPMVFVRGNHQNVLTFEL